MLLILSFAACKSPRQQNNDTSYQGKNISIKHTLSKEEQANDNWVYHYNLKSDSFKYLYDVNAVKVLEDGSMINGGEQISDFILSNSSTIRSIKSDSIIVAHQERAIEYELSESLYAGNERYKNLVIWQTKNAERKRVFEFVIQAGETKPKEGVMDQRRELWIDLCNRNNAKSLIEEMYSEHTLYFNHKPMVQGRALLLKEYQYMNNKEYELFLQPEIVEPVNDKFVFEIGQCSGGYHGKYILVWRKEPDGKWRIFVDSNI